MVRVATFLFVLFLAGNGAAQERFATSKLSIVTAKGIQHFTVEIAETREQHAQGLMYRRRMAADAGMLFIYKTPQSASFWMKNTFIPLDMLFIGVDGKIVNIQERTVPQSQSPVRSKGPVLAILELNGGTTSRLGIKPGDEVRHTMFDK